MTWKQVMQLLDLMDTDIVAAHQLMKLLPPGEASNQEVLSDAELKQQILSHAPNIEHAARGIRELYLRKQLWPQLNQVNE